MNTITEKDIPKTLNFRWRKDGENQDYIIYQHPVTGMLDILNPVASEIFENCDGSNTVGDIADILLKEYQGVKRDEILGDIKGFLTHMVKEKVIFMIGED